ncbi:hypothetical protein GUJ93_ZPchr0023g33384 [Zizania palustris]|uniref:Uncharacterized protein n=1 Tax=Zizania palustris TaxID=103762 RepID=A0A8J5R443_ZIZPA|nr:hypothetical protein GUJ93_ZPchr0023g33384 [Zizania palustris]
MQFNRFSTIPNITSNFKATDKLASRGGSRFDRYRREALCVVGLISQRSEETPNHRISIGQCEEGAEA